MKNIAGLCILSLLSLCLSAQNFEYSVHLKTVTYAGDEMFTIRQDDGTGDIATDIHWKDDGTTNPAAFLSGSYIKASVKLVLVCDNTPSVVYMRGTGPDGIDFISQTCSITDSNITYPLTQSDSAFEINKVRYYAPFSVQWELSFDNIHWYSAGISESIVYVTWHDAPPEDGGFLPNFRYYHTLFDIACRNADGATTEDDIIDKIWNDFTDHSVMNAAGLPLHYYKNLYSPNVYLPQLLKDNDGECYTWAMLFLALLKLNGISEPDNYINIYNHFVSTGCGFGYLDGFLVKTWTFGTPTYNCEDLPYTNIWDSPDHEDNTYLFIYEEVHDETGDEGQTEPNPASIFSNHQVCMVHGKYYDPSYGAVYETINDLRAGAVSGWFYFDYVTEAMMGIDANGDGDLDSSPYYSVMRSTDQVDLTTFDMIITTF